MLVAIILTHLFLLFIFYRAPYTLLITALVLTPSSFLIYELYSEQLSNMKLFLYFVFILILAPMTIYFLDLKIVEKKMIYINYLNCHLFIILVYQGYYLLSMLQTLQIISKIDIKHLYKIIFSNFSLFKLLFFILDGCEVLSTHFFTK